MSFISFTGRHPLFALLAFCLFVFGTAAVAGTGIGWGFNDQAKASASNPHRIPESMDPKSESLSEEIRSIKYEVQEGVVESTETVHSLAMHDSHSQAQPVLDYTTGTSN
jgi:hypothetical protein